MPKTTRKSRNQDAEQSLLEIFRKYPKQLVSALHQVGCANGKKNAKGKHLLPFLMAAREICVLDQGPDSWMLVEINCSLGFAYEEIGRLDQAIKAFRDALRKQLMSEPKKDKAYSVDDLVLWLGERCRKKDPRLAVEVWEKGLRQMKGMGLEDNFSFGEIVFYLIEVYAELGQTGPGSRHQELTEVLELLNVNREAKHGNCARVEPMVFQRAIDRLVAA